MSLIESDAQMAVIRRGASLSADEVKHTTYAKEYERGYVDGASREPSIDEFEAASDAIEQLMPNTLPRAVRHEIVDAVFKAARAKGLEETE